MDRDGSGRDAFGVNVQKLIVFDHLGMDRGWIGMDRDGILCKHIRFSNIPCRVAFENE